MDSLLSSFDFPSRLLRKAIFANCWRASPLSQGPRLIPYCRSSFEGHIVSVILVVVLVKWGTLPLLGDDSSGFSAARSPARCNPASFRISAVSLSALALLCQLPRPPTSALGCWLKMSIGWLDADIKCVVLNGEWYLSRHWFYKCSVHGLNF